MFRGTYENPADLSERTWRKVKFVETAGEDGARWHFLSDACKHCTDASCLAVCPTGALFRRPWGAVDLDQARCSGCRYCVAACPFGVITFNAETGRVNKCVMCPDRVQAGLEPACVATCPTGALAFGDRDQLLGRARARVAELKAKGITAARLYGERELSGLHQLSILQAPPAAYGLPERPRYAVAGVLPGSVASVVASLVAGVGAVVAFRERGGGEE